jgi:hypothetical protein
MSNDTGSKIWKVTKQILMVLWGILGVLFAITVGICAFMWEICHIFDEDYQNRKRARLAEERAQAEHERIRRLIEEATAEEIFNDRSLKLSKVRPQNREESEALNLVKSNPKSRILDLLSERQIEALVMMILRALGII